MGKEARIGLIVVGVLAGALLGLLLKRFVLTGAPEVQRGTEQLATQPHAIPTDDKPTVVTAQNDSPVRSADGLGADTWATGPDDRENGVPHGSYLPADDDGAAPRYAEQQEQVPEADPSHERFAADPPAADPGETTPAAPGALEVGPDGAAALEARQPPTRTPRNPLRRLSAEVPLEQAPSDDTTIQPADRYQQSDALQAPAENLYPDYEAGDAVEDSPASDSGPDDRAAMPRGAADPFSGQATAGEPDLQPFDSADTAHSAPPSDFDDIPPTDELDQRFGTADSGDKEAYDPSTPAREQMPAYEPRTVQPSGQRPLDAPTTVGQEPIVPVRPADGRYAVEPNDNLWKISQKVYGDGRYYKAIAEHNRTTLRHPDRLSTGTVIEVPPAGLLAQSYPALCPTQRRSAVVPSRTIQAAATAPVNGSDVYVVVEGDTLFDIARYELGQASRWGEIYDLNRELLGEDFDFLQPGLQLRMPPRGRPSNPATISRQPTDRYVR